MPSLSRLQFPPKPTDYQFKIAGRFWQFVLGRMGFAGLTTPWRTIYVIPAYADAAWLRNHEMAHIAQINRDGPWCFWPKIVYDYFAYGYHRSPYEKEARMYEKFAKETT